MSIARYAVLADCNISTWTANKTDRRATDKVLMDNYAIASNAAKVNKNLMAGTTLVKDITDFAAMTRAWHIKNTLAWSDRGPRILATSFFLPYKSEMNERTTRFWQLVEKLEKHYEDCKDMAKRSMGNLWNPDDYPTMDEMRSKYRFNLTFTPIAESGDFRLQVAQEELDELKHQYESSFNDRVQDVVKEARDRLHELISNTVEKLTDDAPKDGTEPKAKRYHSTLISNATELCEILRHLNITNDPELERARLNLARVMDGANIDHIRELPEARASMKKKLDSILEEFEW